MAVERDSKQILLFDVDGTLTKPRNKITEEMHNWCKSLKERAVVGIVGGSDMSKISEQIGASLLQEWDYVFPENGLVAFGNGEKIGETSIVDHLGEDALKKIINPILHYIADADVPVKRGTFVEFRTGLLNVSPIGRSCTQEERESFYKWDQEIGLREKMAAHFRKIFAEYDLNISIGGQISMDIFPRGWDKTFCLRYLKKAGFTNIHFFGDKTYEGGNDYEIFASEETVGHTVKGPEDTIKQVEAVLAAKKK